MRIVSPSFPRCRPLFVFTLGICTKRSLARLPIYLVMHRSETRSSLSSGNMFAIINILMQLRKVCNHPDLFESRPIVSPFQADSVMMTVPSFMNMYDAVHRGESLQKTFAGLDILGAELEGVDWARVHPQDLSAMPPVPAAPLSPSRCHSASAECTVIFVVGWAWTPAGGDALILLWCTQLCGCSDNRLGVS